MPEQPSVFDQPPAYTAQERLRALPRMLMEGTPRLHAECQTWLPPFDAEETAPVIGGRSDYETRVSRAVVEPFYERAIKRDVATCLGKQIVLKDDVPSEIRGVPDGVPDPTGRKSTELRDGWFENIDLRGNDGNVFMRAVVEDAVGEGGFSTVLVDHPPVPPGFTLADLDRTKMRPFWRHYKARDVLEAVPDIVNGRERLGKIRLLECGEHDEERVRILYAAPWDKATQALQGWATWELWEKKKDAATGKQVDVLIDAGDMQPHQDIPLGILYFNRWGFFQGRPPYLDLAYMNLRHIRQESDISEDLRVSCGAQLHRAGVTPEEMKQRAIGPRRLLASADPGAKAEWLERSGSAANVYMAYEDNLEAKMERLGNEPHIRRTGNETATASAIDSAKARTEIQARTIAIRDFIEELFSLTAKYINAANENGGSVVIHTPPAHSDFTIEEITAIQAAADAGFIQHFRVAEALKMRGLIPEDVDPEQESELARQQAPPPVAPPQFGGIGQDGLARVRAAVAAADGQQPGAMGPQGNMPMPGGQSMPPQERPAAPMSGAVAGG